MTDDDTFLYFAYGSNMSRRRLTGATRAPSARPVGPATLRRYRLSFDKRSKIDGSGKANCQPTGNMADVVHGGLFIISQSDRTKLDSAEGANGKAGSYQRTYVTVKVPDGEIQALTYLAPGVREELRPYDWYVRHIVVGAEEFGLPAEYVAALRSLPADVDNNLERVSRELTPYEEP